MRPVRLKGAAGTRAVEVLLVERIGRNQYYAKAKPSSKLKHGTELFFGNGAIKARIFFPPDDVHRGMRVVTFEMNDDIETHLDAIGTMPLPPYIKREVAESDRARYQTVYARSPGAIAAPTAGLHFTIDHLRQLEKKGIAVDTLTLHVGLGTFAPVKAESVDEHIMHTERFSLRPELAEKITAVHAARGRVCSVGTTVCRVLESCADARGGTISMRSGEGETDIFIYPPYRFKAVDMLLTNFHLPRTTLLMLVCAFAGRELVFEAYRAAIKERYRFFSYGDAMLIF